MIERYLTKKETERFFIERDKFKRYCKCGHYAYITNKSGIAECSWCHNNVFIDKKTEFEYRMKENLYREKRNNR